MLLILQGVAAGEEGLGARRRERLGDVADVGVS